MSGFSNTQKKTWNSALSLKIATGFFFSLLHTPPATHLFIKINKKDKYQKHPSQQRIFPTKTNQPHNTHSFPLHSQQFLLTKILPKLALLPSSYHFPSIIPLRPTFLSTANPQTKS